MRFLWFTLLAVLLVAVPAMAQPAPVKDPAELFPPDTLLFAELTQPAAVSDHIAGLLHGSVFDDVPAYLEKWYEKHGENNFFSEGRVLSIFSAFLSRETLAEAKRLQGGAVALTGVNKKGNPEIVGFLLTGDSNVPAFIMRMVLASAPPSFIRKAGQVEGVTIYREDSARRFQPVAPMGAVPQPADVEAVHFAQLPGVVLVGSSQESVADVIKRVKGKEKRPSLAGAASFREGEALRQRPGIFLYANPSRGAEQIDAILKTIPNGNESPTWVVAKDLLNPKAIHSLAASLTLGEGSLDLQLAAKLEPTQASALFDLIGDQQVNAAALQAVPRDAAFALTLPLADGAAFWRKLLAAADATAKAAGGIARARAIWSRTWRPS